MYELLSAKISDVNRENWPVFLQDFLAGESQHLIKIESERKLCDNCDYLFFEKEILKFHSSELGEMFFDFKEGDEYHKKQHYGLTKEPLAKALGIKGAGPLRKIWDTTCGTGKDSLLIAHFGAELISFERNPAVYLLLEDALRRFPIKMALHFGDARKSVEKLERPEVIYYDPMYPAKKKSALPRKEMRIFKEIVGDDSDSLEFLEWAMTVATDRVVVKRPQEAAPIKQNPSASYTGKSTRYDMYKIF